MLCWDGEAQFDSTHDTTDRATDMAFNKIAHSLPQLRSMSEVLKQTTVTNVKKNCP